MSPEPAPGTELFPIDLSGHNHRVNDRLRELGPVTRIELTGGVTAWSVTGHAALQELLIDPRIAKRAQHWTALAAGQVPADWPLMPFIMNVSMATSDGSDHRRLRGLTTQAFTARRIEALRPRIEQHVERLLDEVGRAAPGPVDLRAQYAFPLPLTVICELLGVAEDLRGDLHDRSVQLICTGTPPGELLDIEQATYALLSEIAAGKRRNPADDLTTALIEAQDENGSLTPQELAGTLLLLIVAGHETTSSLITNAIRALLLHPQEAEMALSGARPWAAVIEETLRWDAPVGHMPMRYATEDMEFHGQLIRKGDAIMAGYSTAGRDPAQFGADAGRFCPARYDPASCDPASKPVPRHLSFSQGPHYCLGASLARLEAGVALPALFTRFPGMSLARPVEDLKPVESVITNTAAELPVLLSA